MTKHFWNLSLIAATAIFGMTACGEPVGEPGDTDVEATADGDTKVIDGKADAWNWRNDPRHFRTVLNYNFDDLPLEGRTNDTPWTASYWPYYQDGLLARWQDRRGMDAESEYRGLSPAEKYDIAFNGWTPPEGFDALKPFDADTCEFDQEYYDSLGPAGTWTHRNKGLWAVTNGVDDDGDGVADADECQQNTDSGEYDFDSIETWWGICHAWAPAALMEPEPLGAVTRNGVTFDVSDLKGLIIQQWDRASAHMVGGRCNDKEFERDENGRVTNEECRDLNAGSWHVIVTNFIGLNKKGFVIERTTNYEIWNQPLFGYKIDEQREITLQEAHRLLKIEDDGGTGEFVQGVEVGTNEAQAILAFANEATLEQLDDDARLDARAARNIVMYRDGADGQLGTEDDNLFDDLAELADISYVGESAFGDLMAYALANGYSPQVYEYNPEAERFVEVRMTTDWVAEQHQSADRTDTIIDRYTHHDTYHYILELSAEGEVIGGEWVGESNINHPDFVWLPTRAISGNPNIDIDEVRDMIEEGRRAVLGDEEPEAEQLAFSSDEVVAIPDYDPEGATSTITVDREGTVDTVKLDVEISHTYRGDLVVELRHGGIAINVFDGSDAAEAWSDDLSLQGVEVDGFHGSELSGDWELVVLDTYRMDIGQIENWTLTVEATE